MDQNQLYSETQLWRLLAKSEFTQREIAEELDVTPSTVSRQIRRATIAKEE